jgi:acyl-coenzyme A thioesterase PaaI-like protein
MASETLDSLSTPPAATTAATGTPADTVVPQRIPSTTATDDAPDRVTWFDKVEAFISRLSTRDNFWHRICSFIWLPLAFFSGIKMKQLDEQSYAAYLPFRKFNRNWYNAMAGGALLGNAEIAGGMYVFGVVGENYTVVCKHLDYKFLRPCLGPAIYKMTPVENIHELLKTAQEFDLTVDMNVEQQMRKSGEKDRRVGKATVTFHVTHKQLHKLRAKRRSRGKTLNG